MIVTCLLVCDGYSVYIPFIKLKFPYHIDKGEMVELDRIVLLVSLAVEFVFHTAGGYPIHTYRKTVW